ncbi:DNA binding domain protein, excisionase family [Desulfarculus baarsii DSM 2075]|uniref:DNA binding domain protein, excisionase family n=1 Tax=Desulfarculus baarsii (strain ATCC 33931 / DSM 2075 / LMG 7858 / VKM B-1802 / 2st14) TaxID=644282 RepID=E1QDG9_DESB2|nr:helix-turn-helix domain-containing protein [Desulfarculus baarsii]ADK83488.1 DNA binding domain protein, excisionase family [Desulfarculus baarsii DSM 2075]
MSQPVVFLATPQAAELLGISRKTLEKWRLVGGGPSYCKVGRLVRYTSDDLQAWLDSRRRVSTSDPGVAA